MAKRPVFYVKKETPYYCRIDVDFVYNGGFAVIQKQKNIAAIHTAYKATHPNSNILEISSKSMQSLGIKLSAFNLEKFVFSLDKKIPVENIYQGSKRFERSGPFIDLFSTTPKAAKKDERLFSSGKIISYTFEGNDYPLNPSNAFYDWLYINALIENEELASQILQYDAFTDIEYNPEKSLNCQARAAAIYVSLAKINLLDHVSDFNSFVDLLQKE